MTEMSRDSKTVLTELFGDNRAEWPPERFKDLFVQPTYFSKLEAKRPTVLVGGRGTGKSTTLRSLRFDATNERLLGEGRTYGDQSYLGIFVRINKNQVRAFQGGGITQEEWARAFAHFFNLNAALEFCELTLWLEKQTGDVFPSDCVREIATVLAVDPTDTAHELRGKLRAAVAALQLFVNNPSSSAKPLFSMAEVPLVTYCSKLAESGLAEGRLIFCCVDEYENLSDEQQAILNTYIKHAEPPLSYKIGVRQNGLRTRHTIDSSDLLATPDDYRQIDITEEAFEQFAAQVARLRLRRASERGVPTPDSLNDFLEELSLPREADLLGAESVAGRVLEELRHNDDLYSHFSKRPSSETYFLKYWSESEGKSVEALAEDWLSNADQWVNRLNNYGYASLFWLSHGRKGARIRKYYSGARTYISLAGGNIRYFLELLDAAVSAEESIRLVDGRICLSAKAQTLAARFVGQRRLNQLEGLAEHGVELKRLVLAVGKVFFELARAPIGRAPEVTSFVLSGQDSDVRRLSDLLQEGVAHLAIEVAPRTKATTLFELRDDEYRLHPIYCAFFEISHRRKRRMTFDATEVLATLGQKPGRAISQLLGRDDQTPSTDLPDQLALFTSFFEVEPGSSQ